jgi:hypothetical protein
MIGNVREGNFAGRSGMEGKELGKDFGCDGMVLALDNIPPAGRNRLLTARLLKPVIPPRCIVIARFVGGPSLAIPGWPAIRPRQE